MRGEYRVGPVFSVEFELRGDRFNATWSPYMPPAAALDGLLPDYQAARNEFLSHVATDRGATIAVVAVGDDRCEVATIAPRTVH